ncbi:hypothetical protein B0E48_09280 [Rhodanobacter sp. C03]|nr:hypothetical protein B0E48_09280 [Rhodanobacter sp. C03]
MHHLRGAQLVQLTCHAIRLLTQDDNRKCLRHLWVLFKLSPTPFLFALSLVAGVRESVLLLLAAFME